MSTQAYKNVILFGAPGSGKGTQAAKIISHYGLTDITPGNLLREVIKDENHKFYKSVKIAMDAGNLVDISIIEAIVEDKFVAEIKKDDFAGFLFDGFPRSIQQSQFLDRLLVESQMKITAAILLDVDVNILVDRVVNRFTCSSCGAVYNKKSNPTKKQGVCDVCGGTNFSFRSDDNEETIKQRVKVFNDSCRDVIDLYTDREIIKTINASLEIDDITKQIYKILDR